MAQNTDYKNGYDAAVKAIKQKLQDMQNGNDSSTKNSGDGDGSQQNNGMISPEEAVGQQGSGQNRGSENKSRTSKNNENQGVVRPQDCCPPSSSGLSNVPDTAGGMIDSAIGEKIAKQEGYDPEGGSESAVERDWTEAALKETEKYKGNLPGSLVAKIQGLYKPSTDWKKALRNIIGHSLSPEDKRQAYANKNILISQDRIARTDKDKYDNMDYMMVWIDSSGSMSDDQLKMCLSELYSLALAKKPMKLVMVQCDTKIHEIKEWTSLSAFQKDIVKQTVKGRGGTDLKPCWELLKNGCNKDEWKKYTRINPELVIIFTDGGLDQYRRDPRHMPNLCWAILDNPSWDVKYKDRNTKCVHLKTSDIK